MLERYSLLIRFFFPNRIPVTQEPCFVVFECRWYSEVSWSKSFLFRNIFIPNSYWSQGLFLWNINTWKGFIYSIRNGIGPKRLLFRQVFVLISLNKDVKKIWFSFQTAIYLKGCISQAWKFSAFTPISVFLFLFQLISLYLIATIYTFLFSAWIGLIHLGLMGFLVFFRTFSVFFRQGNFHVWSPKSCNNIDMSE